jgi:hypothetical protein
MTLDDLVREWAAHQQLGPDEARRVRNAIVRPAPDVDSDWLWDLLTPVTALIDGPRSLKETLGRAYGV